MGIRLSKEHGVNPSLQLCFLCQEPKGIILFGAHRFPDGGTEAPRSITTDYEPCDKCKALMEQGVILISVREHTETETPYRTGGWCVVKDEALSRMLSNPEPFLKKRVAYVSDAIWDALGLPRGEVAASTREESEQG